MFIHKNILSITALYFAIMDLFNKRIQKDFLDFLRTFLKDETIPIELVNIPKIKQKYIEEEKKAKATYTDYRSKICSIGNKLKYYMRQISNDDDKDIDFDNSIVDTFRVIMPEKDKPKEEKVDKEEKVKDDIDGECELSFDKKNTEFYANIIKKIDDLALTLHGLWENVKNLRNIIKKAHKVVCMCDILLGDDYDQYHHVEKFLSDVEKKDLIFRWKKSYVKRIPGYLASVSVTYLRAIELKTPEKPIENISDIIDYEKKRSANLVRFKTELKADCVEKYNSLFDWIITRILSIGKKLPVIDWNNESELDAMIAEVHELHFNIRSLNKFLVSSIPYHTYLDHRFDNIKLWEAKENLGIDYGYDEPVYVFCEPKYYDDTSSKLILESELKPCMQGVYANNHNDCAVSAVCRYSNLDTTDQCIRRPYDLLKFRKGFSIDSKYDDIGFEELTNKYKKKVDVKETIIFQ